VLTPEESIIVEHMLMEDEGVRVLPYFDCCGREFRKCECKPQGKLTIGVGRNLEDTGLSENECQGLLSNDVKRTTVLVERSFPWFEKISTARRLVIISMAFNMGIDKLKEFKKMIRQIESGDFYSASKEMLNSKWAAQVKHRAVRLSEIMEKGEF
jgi:lysozyme